MKQESMFAPPASRATRSPFHAAPKAEFQGVDIKIGSFTLRLVEARYIELAQWVMANPKTWRSKLQEAIAHCVSQ